MTLKHKLLRYFFPAILIFITLSWLSSRSPIQNFYYPFFEKLSLTAVAKSQPEVYFKTKLNADNTPNNPDQITILFNSKKHLKSLLKIAKKTGKKSAYDYKGFIIYITETFITPLIFFLSLILITPNRIRTKLIGLFLGTALIIGFGYVTVLFRGLTLVADAGIKDLAYLPREKEFYRLIAYSFSSVTSVTVAILLWILLGINKNSIKQLFS